MGHDLTDKEYTFMTMIDYAFITEKGRNAMIQHNEYLLNKYPWLLPRSRFTDQVSDKYDYSYTELDNMPAGWRIAFGEQMCFEIQQELEKFNCVDKFRILDIKEKFGELRFYYGGAPDESNIEYIISKYEKLSRTTCINCGRPANVITMGWISPFCYQCAPVDERLVDIKEYFEE